MAFVCAKNPMFYLKRLLIPLTIIVVIYKYELTNSQLTVEEECIVPNPFSSEIYDLKPRVASSDYWHLRFDVRQLKNVIPLSNNEDNQKTDKFAKAIKDGGFVDVYLSVCHPLTFSCTESNWKKRLALFTDHTFRHGNNINISEEQPSCLEFSATSGCSDSSAVCGIVTTYHEKFQVNFGNYFKINNKIDVSHFPPPLHVKNEDSGTFSTLISLSRGDETATTDEYFGTAALNTSIPTLPKFIGMELAVHYQDGSQCGDTSFSSFVTFKCSDREVLILAPIVKKCFLRFELSTRDACSPGTKSLNSCITSIRATGHTINLTSLWNPNGFTVKPQDDQRLIFSVCGFLKRELCGGFIGATACLIEGNEVKVVGTKNGPLVRETNGSYFMTKEKGQSCRIPGLQFSMSIRFLCDPYKGNSIPSTVKVHNSTCNFFVDWHTSLACEEENRCSVRVGKGFYDLSRLKSKKLTVIKTKVEGTVIVLSVCKALSIEQGCPEEVGACIVSNTRNISLGQPSKNLLVEKSGNPSLHYENGSPCSFDSKRKFSSRIYFHCLTHQRKDIIEERGTTDDCIINFDWWTAEACLQTDDEGNCSFVDEVSKTILDFSSLDKPSGYTLRDAVNNKTLVINICNPLLSTFTGSKIFGALVLSHDGKTKLTYAGLSSSRIYLKNGLPTLKYVGSTSEKKQEVKTLISFMCSAKGVEDQFYKMIYKDNTNTYYVIWYTELACLPKHECSIGSVGGITYSFRDLRRPLGKYSISVSYGLKEYNIVLNLCQPLPPTLNCTLGSSICWINMNTNHSVDLGFFNDALEGSNTIDQPLKLRYTNGALCNQNTGQRFSAYIVFKCGQEEGTPSVKILNECQFELKWQTQYACPQMEKFFKASTNISKRSDPEYKLGFEDISVDDHIAKRSGEADSKMPESHIKKELLGRSSVISNGNIPIFQNVNNGDSTNTTFENNTNDSKTFAIDSSNSEVTDPSLLSIGNNESIFVTISPLKVDNVTTLNENQEKIKMPEDNASTVDTISIIHKEANINSKDEEAFTMSTNVTTDTSIISLTILNETTTVKIEPDDLFTPQLSTGLNDFPDTHQKTNAGFTPIDMPSTYTETVQGYFTVNANDTSEPYNNNINVNDPFKWPTSIIKEKADATNDVDIDQSPLLPNAKNEMLGSDSLPSLEVNNIENSGHKSVDEFITKNNTFEEYVKEAVLPITTSSPVEFAHVEPNQTYKFPVWLSSLIVAILLVLLIVGIAIGVLLFKKWKFQTTSMYPEFACCNRRK